jgi:hypothetical protein
MLPVLFLLGIACSGTTSTTPNPVTGVVVRAETVTTGRGCGTGATQVFKYAVVVFGFTAGDPDAGASYSAPITANVFDCFTDGAFFNLAPTNGSATYRLEVYIYNEATYDAASNPAGGNKIDQAASVLDTNALRTTTPTWTTECRVSQLQNVEAPALCDPVTAGLGGVGVTEAPTQIMLATSTFHLSAGRTATCASSDAGADGGASDASVAPDARDSGSLRDAEAGADAEGGADADAGPIADAGSLSFTTALVRYRTQGAISPTKTIRCPDPFTTPVAADPVQYDIDVGLLDQTGAPLGQTVCTVTAKTGTLSTAVCP